MKGWLTKLAGELAYNGKSLVAWVLNETPIGTMPGIGEALHRVYENPTDKIAWGNVVIQGLWTVASGHKAFKIIDVMKRK